MPNKKDKECEVLTTEMVVEAVKSLQKDEEKYMSGCGGGYFSYSALSELFNYMIKRDYISKSELKNVIEKMIKDNTSKNRYRDGETAFDINRDIQDLLQQLDK